MRLGLPVLVIGIAMITTAYLNVGQSLQNGRPPPCFPETCPSLAYFAILGLVGFFVALWGVLQTIAGFIIREGYLEYESGPLAPPQAGSGPEDENILAMARGLQGQIKRPKFGTIVSLAWSDDQAWYWAGFKRTGIRKPATLLLSADLRGRIDAKDWKILLTYYFLLLKPRPRLLLEFLGFFLGSLVLIPFVGLAISLEFGLQASRFFAQFVAGPWAVVAFILIFPAAKRLALRQDRLTAESVGQKALLEVFRKIDRLQLPRVENAKRRHGWLARLWPMPNITERVRNLTTIEGGSD